MEQPCNIDDEEPDLLDSEHEGEDKNLGVAFCENKWREVTEDPLKNSFWKAVAIREVSGATGAEILSKWRICPVVEPHPQFVLPKQRFAKIDERIASLNEKGYATEDDVSKLTELILTVLPSSFQNRNPPLRLKEGINTYLSALVKLEHSKKQKWTEMDWTTAIYAAIQNFFWLFENRSNSEINADHFPAWITPSVKPDFCSSNKRPFLVTEYGLKKKSATHKDLFKLLQTMRSIIRRWQLDYPNLPAYDNVYGLLIGADSATAFQMYYDATHDIYCCCVFLEDSDDRSTFTLSMTEQDVFISLNVVLSIMQSASVQASWGKKVAGKRKMLTEESPSNVQPAIDTPNTDKKMAALRSSSNKSPSRLSDNTRINSSATDASVGELTKNLSSMELSSEKDSKDDDSDKDDDDGNDDHGDRNKPNKSTKNQTQAPVQTTNTKSLANAPKGAAAMNVKTKKKQIPIENMFTVDDPEMFVRPFGMFLVVANLTRHARVVVRYDGSGTKYLAKLDDRDSPLEVEVLKRLGTDNKKFIHPVVTQIVSGVHVTLFEWKVNKIREAKSNIPQVRRIAKQVLEALVDLHAIGICHGDVKFDNIIDTGDQAYLVDFNLSYQPKVYRPNSRGTAGYRAPEIVTRKNYSDKADIYAFGIFVLELVLFGEPIYHYTKEKDDMKVYVWLRDEVIGVVQDKLLQQLILQCMTEDEIIRPTAAELLQDEFFHKSTKEAVKVSKARKPLEDVTNKVH